MEEKLVCFKDSDQVQMQLSKFIRNTVFVIEQNVPESLEFDNLDHECNHYLYYSNEIPVATARYRWIGSSVKLERFAVLKDFRRKGIGKKILKQILTDLKEEKGRIYLHAQESAVKFYTENGFQIAGDSFEEAGIKHYLMTLK